MIAGCHAYSYGSLHASFGYVSGVPTVLAYYSPTCSGAAQRTFAGDFDACTQWNYGQSFTLSCSQWM